MAAATPVAATTSATDGGERGAGLLPTVAGVAVFLVLLLFAVQVLLNLYATSVVTGAAYDAARTVAATGGDPMAVEGAEDHARSVMGRYGDRVEFEWDVAGDDVVLHVSAENRMFAFPGGVQRLDRTVRARIECVRTEDGACE